MNAFQIRDDRDKDFVVRICVQGHPVMIGVAQGTVERMKKDSEGEREREKETENYEISMRKGYSRWITINTFDRRKRII